MVIHINPNRINTTSGGKIARRETSQQDADEAVVPSRAHVNYIPGPESLSTLIRSALAALRKGVFWERGSILNLLV